MQSAIRRTDSVVRATRNLNRTMNSTIEPRRTIYQIKQLKISSKQWTSTVKQLNQEHQANNVYHATTKSELIKYLHQAVLSPVKATWKKAIENRQFTT